MDRTSKPGIYRRGKAIVFVLPFVDAKGRRRQKWVSRGEDGQPFRTLDAADKERTRLRYRRDTGLDISPAKLTLDAFGVRWLAYKKPQLAHTTYVAYADAFKRARPHIGGVLLTSLKPFHIQAMLDTMTAAGVAPGTLNQTRSIISRALRQAEAWDLVPRNVAANVKGPKQAKRDFYLPTNAELSRLFDAAEEQGIGALVRLAVLTGMRIGELLALTWSDVDFDGAGLQVRAAKTPAGIRRVSLDPLALRLLRGLRERDGIVQLEGLVFGLRRMQTVWPWRKTRVAAGLERLHFHDLRHISVSKLIELGVDFKVIQERVGHSSIRVTLDRYGHLKVGADAEAAERIGRALEGL